MRWREIIAEAQPTATSSGGGNPPLTPEQARKRKAKCDKAAQRVRDVQAANAVRLAAARRKATEA